MFGVLGSGTELASYFTVFLAQPRNKDARFPT